MFRKWRIQKSTSYRDLRQTDPFRCTDCPFFVYTCDIRLFHSKILWTRNGLKICSCKCLPYRNHVLFESSYLNISMFYTRVCKWWLDTFSVARHGFVFLSMLRYLTCSVARHGFVFRSMLRYLFCSVARHRFVFLSMLRCLGI